MVLLLYQSRILAASDKSVGIFQCRLSFYLAAVDHNLKHPQDNPTIGILLCESRSKIIAEYALKNINAPIGVSEYTLAKALPKELKTDLPTIEEIEAELNEAIDQKDYKKKN